MTGNTEAYVAELASSQIEPLSDGAVVEAASDDVTVAVSNPGSDLSALVSATHTVGEAPDPTTYYPAEGGNS